MLITLEKFTNGAVKGKTGSLTALPIIETQAGDVSAFVPTNVISITDGQIFLETDLFNSGIRPAINAGLSVSRVVVQRKLKLSKNWSGGLRLSLAQYRELAAFSQFVSDLDEATRKQLERGQRIMEVLKQKQYPPLSVAEMAFIWFVTDRGYLDDVSVKSIQDFENALMNYLRDSCSDLIREINANPALSEEHIQKMKKAIEEFKQKEW